MSDCLRSDSAAQANFAGALQNAGQHDVHDADAADQQRDGGDGHHDGVEQMLGALLLGQQLGRHHDAEVVGAVMRRIQNRPEPPAPISEMFALSARLR